MKEFWKSKTMWVGFAVGFLGLVQATLEQAPMEASTQGMILGGVGALMMFLRSITTEAVGKG